MSDIDSEATNCRLHHFRIWTPKADGGNRVKKHTLHKYFQTHQLLQLCVINIKLAGGEQVGSARPPRPVGLMPNDQIYRLTN